MRAGLLVLLCWAVVDAQPYPDVYPPGATVAVNNVVRSPGEPLAAKDGDWLRISRPGYATAELQLKGPTPSDPPLQIRLRPLTWQQGAADWARLHSLPLGTGLVLLPLGAVLAWRHRRLPAKDPNDPLVGRKLGRWRLLAKLGQGGMAAVYKGVPDLTLNEREAVAVKVMDVAYAQHDAEARPRFEREARLAASLEHPHIVRTLSHGEHAGLLYMTMELVRGTPLSRRLTGQGMPLEEAIALVRPVLEALSFAHSRGIVHRDVKPENVMLAEGGRVLLMDFGVARAQDVTAITPTGMAMGSPSYMPPEQLTGGAVDPRADQYSLGIMLYQLVTGRLPFTGGTASEVALQHVTGSPEPPRTWRPELPLSVQRVILKMIRKDPQARFPDLAAAGAALERALREPDAFAEWEVPATGPVRPAPSPKQAAPPEDPGEDTVGVPRID